MNTTTRITAIAIAIGYGAGAWAHTIEKGDIQIIHPWVEPSEGYSTRTHPTISNEGDDPITFVGAETSIADQMLIIREGLVLDRLVIVGEDIVSFGDDGLYLTLVGLKEPLEDGAHFPVTFHFDGSESIDFYMVVGESTMMPGMDMSGKTDDSGDMHEMHGMPAMNPDEKAMGGHGHAEATGGGRGDGHGDKHSDHSDAHTAEHDGHGDARGAMYDPGDAHAAAADAAEVPQETILTITHAPIEAIGWPEMTTDFTLADGASITDVNVGDRVHFVLVADSDGIYAVKSIGQLDRGAPPTGDSELLGEGVIETIAGRKL